PLRAVPLALPAQDGLAHTRTPRLHRLPDGDGHVGEEFSELVAPAPPPPPPLRGGGTPIAPRGGHRSFARQTENPLHRLRVDGRVVHRLEPPRAVRRPHQPPPLAAPPRPRPPP